MKMKFHIYKKSPPDFLELKNLGKNYKILPKKWTMTTSLKWKKMIKVFNNYNHFFVIKGDEFMSVKPWLGTIKEPSSYYKDPLN